MRSLGRKLLCLTVAGVVAASLAAYAHDTPEPLVPLGSFSSLRQDSEHCNGYSVELWRFGASLRGLFRACAGLAGDIRTGIIGTGSHDQTSGAISFEANLSLGMDYLKGGVETPSKDHFSFIGTLAGDALTGKLARTDEVYPNRKPHVESVRLKRRREKLPSYSSHLEWQREAEKVMHNPAAK